MIRISVLLSSLLFAGSLFADSAQIDFFAAVQGGLFAAAVVTLFAFRSCGDMASGTTSLRPFRLITAAGSSSC